MSYSPYYEIYLIKKLSETNIKVHDDENLILADQPANYIPSDFWLQEKSQSVDHGVWEDFDPAINGLSAISMTQLGFCIHL